jgi:hypothetical protein
MSFSYPRISFLNPYFNLSQNLIEVTGENYLSIEDNKLNADEIDLSAHISGVVPVANGGTSFSTFTQGDILYSSASNTLAKLAKNTSATRVLTNTGSSNNPAWAQVDLTSGVTGILPNGNTTATDANTASAIVSRDGSGNFSATTITANLTGNATSATNIGTATEASDTTCFPVFVTASGSQTLPAKTNTGLTYDSSTNNLGATTFTGNATSASNVVTTAPTDNVDYYLGGFQNTSGTQDSKVLTYTTFNPVTNQMVISNNGATDPGIEVLSVSSGNEPKITLTRPSTSKYGRIHYKTLNTENWTSGLRTSDSNFHIHDEVNDVDTINIAPGVTNTATITATVNLPGLTASRAVVTDGSKNLASLQYTDANTASTLVSRDGSGNFSAGTISGALSGNATTASTLQTARNIGAVSFDGSAAIVPQTIQTVDETVDTTCFLGFFNSSGTQASGQQPKTNTGLTYDSSTNNLGATTFTGALTGAATQVGTTTQTTGTYYPLMVSSSSSGNQAANMSASFSLAPDGTSAFSTSQDNGGFSFTSTGGSVYEQLKRNAGTNIAQYIFSTGGTNNWQTGLTAADTHYYVRDGVNSVNVIDITPGATPTTTINGTTNLSGLTASRAVVTDGSKNLASLQYTDANTASTLVQRDGSGNFTAGTITAALTGAATQVGTTAASGDVYYRLFGGTATSGNQATAATSNMTYNPSLNRLGLVSTTDVVINLNSTVSGEPRVNLDRAATTQNAQLHFLTSSGDKFSLGLRAGDTHCYLRDAVNSVNVLDITPGATPTTTINGTTNLSGLTASQAVVTDGSKNLASLQYTDANTASTLVQRNGSGNFTAGTITAALTGTATNATNIGTTVQTTGTYYPLMVSSSSSGNQAANMSANFSMSPNGTSTFTTSQDNGGFAFTSSGGSVYEQLKRNAGTNIAQYIFSTGGTNNWQTGLTATDTHYYILDGVNAVNVLDITPGTTPISALNGWLQVKNSTAPGSNPTSSGYLYSESGAGKWRGSGGTITTFGPGILLFH